MKNIAVIGSGISGLSAAWLLSQKHNVTIFEKDDRLGGHSNTCSVDGHFIDTGFIVYNIASYPNFIAFLEHLKVSTQDTDMSFSVSKDDGRLEYSGESPSKMFVQKRNLFKPRYWQMVRDILRFYKEAPNALRSPDTSELTLGEYLAKTDYGAEFIEDHLIPMGAAIWSTPASEMMDYPLRAFVRFCENHGLLQLKDRPQWRTITGGSLSYVRKVEQAFSGRILFNAAVRSVVRGQDGISVECRDGRVERFDEVVFATHADQALRLLAHPTNLQSQLLGKFRYSKNLAVLHTDSSFMPKRKRAWASWNYLADGTTGHQQKALSLTYWMNRLHRLDASKDYFVTLNPASPPAEGSVVRSFPYEHPLFDRDAIAAQQDLWKLQGQENMWFCGSYFGYGFHEDGIQSGLAVAELLGDLKRPWEFDFKRSRICLPDNTVKLRYSNVA
ncbi:NAD(P)/FAD-dependent oxidoreductase [Sneathiella glossodoripedis]|uniref:NAD(P)/FAD-dependent oxidoreductase n=1 Tax=Sneathiella glossodoripedis TaxID=418853 RepID=UPI00047004A7|nr:FAD-dependent oxidoreductase [Sneathiella glossodoripedis]